MSAPDHRAVGGDDDHIQAVNLVELFGLGLGRTGHAGQFLVHAEVVLQRDRRVGDVLALDAQTFFGFYRLMQAVAPAPARHHASSELVDDDDLALVNDVILVALIEHVGPNRLLHVVDQLKVVLVVQVLNAD